MLITTIQDIYQQPEKLSELEKIKVGGWVKSIRQNKFIELNDGSCLSNLQLVCPPDLVEELKKANFNSNLIVNGKLILTPGRTQHCELHIRKIELIAPPSEGYPLQKKK